MIKIGIICPSEIAFRRFLPALKQDNRFMFAGIGVASATEWYGENTAVDLAADKDRMDREIAKAQTFLDKCNCGKIFNSYTELVTNRNIDAIYIPLPPALHYKWAKIALDNGKHVFVEKPSTTNFHDTKALIDQAHKNGLALHENYMFIYHDQLKAVNDIVARGEIGDVRLYRISFGFPRRSQHDFRYNKLLGG